MIGFFAPDSKDWTNIPKLDGPINFGAIIFQRMMESSCWCDKTRGPRDTAEEYALPFSRTIHQLLRCFSKLRHAQ